MGGIDRSLIAAAPISDAGGQVPGDDAVDDDGDDDGAMCQVPGDDPADDDDGDDDGARYQVMMLLFRVVIMMVMAMLWW